MSSGKITNGEGFMLTALALMTNSYSVVYGVGNGASAPISNLIATIAAIACAYLLACVCDKYPQRSFFAVIKTLLGSTFGLFCSFLLILLTLSSGVVSLVVFNRFIQLTALPRTPQIIIPLILVLIASLSFRSGLRSIAGTARLIFWFAVFVLAVFLIFGINFALPRAMSPAASDVKVFLEAIGEAFINRFGAIFALMSVYTRMHDTSLRRRYFVGGVAAAGLAFSIIAFMTGSILGARTCTRDFYPAFTAMSIIEAGGFLQHPEILSSIVMTISAFFKVSVCILFAGDMLSGIFDVPSKEGAAVPIGLICVSATQLIYRNAPALRRMTEWRSPAVFVLGFELLLPVLLISIARISGRRTAKKE